MPKVTLANTAKLGFLLFVPVEIIRILTQTTDNSWSWNLVLLGQGLILGAAAWQTFVGPPNGRVIYVICGLMFLMVPVWPWFTRLEVGPAAVSAAGLEAGVHQDDLFTPDSQAKLTTFTLLHLIDAPVTSFAVTPHGCGVAAPRSGAQVVINTLPAGVRAVVLITTAVVGFISAAGSIFGAYNLFKLAKNPVDKAWVLGGSLAALVLAFLLLTQSQAFLLQKGCEPLPEAQNLHNVTFWFGLIVNPFGPLLLTVALVALWRWPGRLAGRFARRGALRASLGSKK
ncbi:MAG: hypothetical protein JXB47_04805 [Anaerolineae bacterium]|nr:hypothetical protein [Anaerolineae bacterium]